MSSEDRQLLEQIANGDVKALGILYVLYSAKIRNFALSLLQNPVEAEDVTQDIFLKIWNARESLRNVGSVKSYIFSMTHNSVLNFIKNKNVRNRYKETRAAAMTDVYEPSANMDTKELLRSIDFALEEMSELRKTIFRMSRFENKTYQEIADALMISPKTVQYHISCALAELRKLL